MMNGGRKWAVGAVVAIVAVGLWQCRGPARAGADGPAALTAPVTSGPMLITVRASGEVRARLASKVIPQIKRDETVNFLVPEGTHVASNDVVARLATDEIDRRILDAETKLADAESKELAARTDVEIQLLDNATTVAVASQTVRSAKLELEKFSQGDSPMDRRKAQLKVETTASEAERSKKRYAEAKQLLEQGFITEDQVEEERIKMETSRVDSETAQQELKSLHDYELPLKEATARNAQAKADAELEKALKTSSVQLATKKQAHEAAQRLREKARQDLDQLKEDRVAYDVKSPTDGIVTYGDVDNPWHRNEVQVGMKLSPGEVLLTIPDMSRLQAVVDVPEADVHKVAVGQRVTITVEAMSGRTFAGAVERVAEVANPSGWLESAVKEFRVTILLDDAAGLRPGFSCEAEIVVDSLPNAVQVPVQAVSRDGVEYVAYRPPGGAADRTVVTVGKSSTTHVQILSGLKAGQSVLLVRPPAKSEEKKP